MSIGFFRDPQEDTVSAEKPFKGPTISAPSQGQYPCTAGASADSIEALREALKGVSSQRRY